MLKEQQEQELKLKHGNRIVFVHLDKAPKPCLTIQVKWKTDIIYRPKPNEIRTNYIVKVYEHEYRVLRDQYHNLFITLYDNSRQNITFHPDYTL